MKTIKANKMVMELLEDARIHIRLALGDSISKLDYLDMAMQEINVAFRKAKLKKGYEWSDLLDEIYEYTNWFNLGKDSKCTDYIERVREVKRQMKK